MKQEDAPTGTVVVIGHANNGQTATKQPDGTWRNNVTLRIHDAESDIARGSYAVYIPGVLG